MDFTIEIPNLQTLVARLHDTPAIATPILQRAVAQSTLILAANTNSNTVPVRSGFLVNHFQQVIGDLKAWWYPTASYARYVEFGTAPHVIEAKNAKALYWPGADHPVKSVNHPGTKANPYMERIVAAATPEINTAFELALNQIVAALAA